MKHVTQTATVSLQCLTGVINFGRIALPMTETDASILVRQQNVGFTPRASQQRMIHGRRSGI